MDLAPYCNQPLNDQLPGEAQDLWLFPKETTTICGVPFRFVDPEKNNGKGTKTLFPGLACLFIFKPGGGAARGVFL